MSFPFNAIASRVWCRIGSRERRGILVAPGLVSSASLIQDTHSIEMIGFALLFISLLKLSSGQLASSQGVSLLKLASGQPEGVCSPTFAAVHSLFSPIDKKNPVGGGTVSYFATNTCIINRFFFNVPPGVVDITASVSGTPHVFSTTVTGASAQATNAIDATFPGATVGTIIGPVTFVSSSFDLLTR